MSLHYVLTHYTRYNITFCSLGDKDDMVGWKLYQK